MSEPRKWWQELLRALLALLLQRLLSQLEDGE